MDFKFWEHVLRSIVIYTEHFSPEAGEDLNELITLIKQFPHALPRRGECPYCRATYLVGHYRFPHHWDEIVVHEMRVVEYIPTCAAEYRAGYRARWRCKNPACQEQELR
jgi:hypothetical protein